MIFIGFYYMIFIDSIYDINKMIKYVIIILNESQKKKKNLIIEMYFIDQRIMFKIDKERKGWIKNMIKSFVYVIFDD